MKSKEDLYKLFVKRQVVDFSSKNGCGTWRSDPEHGSWEENSVSLFVALALGTDHVLFFSSICKGVPF
jgi:hypothetical protein